MTRSVWRSRICARILSCPWNFSALVGILGAGLLCWLLRGGLLGSWQYWEHKCQDLKKKEIKLNSPSELTNVILLHLEAIGVTGSQQICPSTWTFTAPSASQGKPGKRGKCCPWLSLPNSTLEGLQAAVLANLVKDIFTTGLFLTAFFGH